MSLRWAIVLSIVLGMIRTSDAVTTLDWCIVLPGQSNEVGVGTIPTIPDATSNHLWNFQNSYTWQQSPIEPMDDPLNQVDCVSADAVCVPEAPSCGNPASVEPNCVAFSFAQTLGMDLLQYYPSWTFGFIPCAKGGSTVSDWLQQGTGHFDRATLGGSCEWRIHCATAMDGACGIQPVMCSNVVVASWQGESDAQSLSNATQWAARQETFIAGWRSDFPTLWMGWAFAQLANVGLLEWPYRDTVRDQQVTAANATTNTKMVPAAQYGCLTSAGNWQECCSSTCDTAFIPNPPDPNYPTHADPIAQRTMGRRFAQALATLFPTATATPTATPTNTPTPTATFCATLNPTQGGPTCGRFCPP